MLRSQAYTFWRQSKARVRLYINRYSNFRSIFNRFGDIDGFVRQEPLFYTPLLFRLKIGGVPFGVDP